MKSVKLRMLLSSAAYFLLFSNVNINAGYIEGIDTTDIYGFGFDSSFNISLTTKTISGNGIIRYGFNGAPPFGYLYCSFEDAKMVPDTVIEQFPRLTYDYNFVTFIFKNIKDSSYVKAHIVNNMGNGRFVYRYGKTSNHSEKILEYPDYDRSIRYKPNNLRFHGLPYPDTLFWDPPLPNDNHLLGYILYASKNSWNIDTAKPIDAAQWDSLAFIPASTINIQIYPNFNLNRLQLNYINMVAVYEEGRSDYLDGWSLLDYRTGISRPALPFFNTLRSTITISRTQAGLFFDMPETVRYPSSFSIFNADGSIHYRIKDINNNRVYLSTESNNFATGLYLLRAEFSDRSVITQPFTITR